MGEPVRILTLAEELIRLSGLVPYRDIDIVFTGLKPGEKLFEELLLDGEGVKPTTHKKIRVVAPVETDLRRANASLEELFGLAQSGDLAGVIRALQEVVPEFVPRYNFDGSDPSPVFQRVRPDLFPPQKASIIRTLRVASQNEGSAA
ncbi:MAG TPA: polysaccharide biosynthesis protein [Geomonas sp.]|nr:polysaccharide biosynthesis protein [Geomonas sp.]HJV36781.1 polysaccharide biosynthesis protein [Geomonas sp.]